MHRYPTKRVALLTALLLPIAAQAEVQPQVIHRFDAGEPLIFSPPVWEPQRAALVGVTRAGGDDYDMVTFVFGGVGIPSTNASGLAYSLKLDGSEFRSASLGGTGGTPLTNLVVMPSGDVIGGSSFAAWLDPADSVAKRVGTLFRLDADLNVTAHRPSDSTTLGAFQVRGQLAADREGNLFAPDGYADVAIDRLVKLGADHTLSTAVDFELYRQPFAVNASSNPITWPAKGNLPYAQIWSSRDNALYLATAVHAWGGARPDCLPGEPDPGLSKPDCSDGSQLAGHLLRISGDALARGVQEQDIEILFHFTALTGGAPVANDGNLTALVEDGDYLYGTSFAAPQGSGGTGGVWRIRKADLPANTESDDSFAFVHVFTPALSAVRTNHVPAAGEPAIEATTPHGSLVVAADGAIYGTTQTDDRTVIAAGSTRRAAGAGAIFRIVPGTADDRSDDQFEIAHLLDASAVGSTPVGLNLGPSVGGEQYVVGATAATAGSAVFAFTVDIPPGEVTLTSSTGDASVETGSSVQLSWTTNHIDSCTATASSAGVTDWQGAKDPAGGQQSIVAPTGETDYRLDCVDTGGRSVQSSVRVRAAVPTTPEVPEVPQVPETPSVPERRGGGGGGAFDWLLLATLGLGRIARSVRPRRSNA